MAQSSPVVSKSSGGNKVVGSAKCCHQLKSRYILLRKFAISFNTLF